MNEEGPRSKDTSKNGERSDVRFENGVSAEFTAEDTVSPDQAINHAGVGLFQVKLIILSGFVWMARGFEIVILTQVSKLLTCGWKLNRWHEALLYTITVFSTTLGCFLYGIWSDNYGRRTALSSSLIFMFVFGAVSAGLPNYTWFVIFRVVTDFAVGGLPQSLVLCCEFMPGRQRGRAVYILSCFWAIGVVIMLTIFYSVVESEGNWRIFVAIGTLPAFLAMVLMRFFPESFRYLMVTDQFYEANEVMAEMTEANSKTVSALLEPLPSLRRKKLVCDLFTHPLARSTILFWIMGFITSITFIGLTILTPQLKDLRDNLYKPTEVSTMNFLSNLTEPVQCLKTLSQTEFIFIVWTTALDFPGFVIYMILVDVIDRKILLCSSYLFVSLFIFMLFVPISNAIVYSSFIFCARTLLHGQFDLLLLMVAETFPTSHRGTAVGLEAAGFYLGQILSSYVIQGLLWYSMVHPIILYGALTFLCAITSLLLKYETREKDLVDIIKK